jgi:hypothetical protein
MHYHLKTPTYFTLYSCGHMFYQYIHKMEAGHKVKEVFPLHYADIITHNLCQINMDSFENKTTMFNLCPCLCIRIKKAHGKNKTIRSNLELHPATICLCIKSKFSIQLLIKWINMDMKS